MKVWRELLALAGCSAGRDGLLASCDGRGIRASKGVMERDQERNGM